jgi:hypothetical protein
LAIAECLLIQPMSMLSERQLIGSLPTMQSAIA